MTSNWTEKELIQKLKNNPDLKMASSMPTPSKKRASKGRKSPIPQPKEKTAFVIGEKELSQQLEELLDMFDWRWMHQRPAQTLKGWRTALSGYKGFPDYLALKGKRIIVIELKGNTGKLTKEQTEWLGAFRGCLIECYIWRPKDFPEIVETLRPK